MATGAGSSSRHPQRAMGEGAGRERTPLSRPPPRTSCQLPSSGLCLQAGIGFLPGTMPGPRVLPPSLTRTRLSPVWPSNTIRRLILGQGDGRGGLTGGRAREVGVRRLRAGAAPRTGGHRGARGIVSLRRGRHPAGGRRSGAAHGGAAHGTGGRAGDPPPSWGKEREKEISSQISPPRTDASRHPFSGDRDHACAVATCPGAEPGTASQSPCPAGQPARFPGGTSTLTRPWPPASARAEQRAGEEGEGGLDTP